MELISEKLFQKLDEPDVFDSVPIVVPNKYVQSWLKMSLLKKFGVTLGIDVLTFDAFMKDLVFKVTGR